MFTTISLFIVGFVFLIKGADLLVDGSSSIAKRYGISNLVIGLTIVAFGTSTPELLVSVLAAIRGSAGVALGNAIGSNISNTLLILGAVAIIRPLVVKKSTVSKEIPLSLLAIVALGFLANDALIDGALVSFLSRIDGLVLMLFFVIFAYYTFGISKADTGVIENLGGEKIHTHSHWKSTGMIIIGLIGLYLGGEWIVGGATEFGRFFGISETIIGLTIVAIGTSLPELAASAVAARKGHTDLAIGNIVGSNIFNIFWVLGASSIIAPLRYSASLNIDIVILFCSTILVLLLIFIGKKNVIRRQEGILMVLLYLLYLVFLIYRA